VNSEHANLLAWLGLDKASEFDPTYFNAKDVNFSEKKVT